MRKSLMADFYTNKEILDAFHFSLNNDKTWEFFENNKRRGDA